MTGHPFGGVYVFDFGTAVTGKLLVASPAFANDSSVHGAVDVGPCGGGTQGIACAVGNDANHVLIETTSSAGVLQDHSFYVAMF